MCINYARVTASASGGPKTPPGRTNESSDPDFETGQARRHGPEVARAWDVRRMGSETPMGLRGSKGSTITNVLMRLRVVSSSATRRGTK